MSWATGPVIRGIVTQLWRRKSRWRASEAEIWIDSVKTQRDCVQEENVVWRGGRAAWRLGA